jgi:hypothetical protein
MDLKRPMTLAVALLFGAGVTPVLAGLPGRSAGAADGPRASMLMSAGLVRQVDTHTNTLVLETGKGVQRVHMARAATIRDDHDDALTLGEIRPGDAVSYEGTADAATALYVARQFWAIPRVG